MSDKKWSELMAEYSEELATSSKPHTEFLGLDTALPAWVKWMFGGRPAMVTGTEGLQDLKR